MARMFIGILIALTITPAISAQNKTGRVSGRVTDPRGFEISGAQVRLLNNRGLAERASDTDAAGRFSFDKLVPGDYVLRIEMSGFTRLEAHQTVREGDTLDLSLELQLGPCATDCSGMVEPIDHAGRQYLASRETLAETESDAPITSQEKPQKSAKTGSGHIKGSVRDATGAEVSGAKVKVRLPTGMTVAETVSDDLGVFAFEKLVGELYVVEIERPGFKVWRGLVSLEESGERTLVARLEIQIDCSLRVEHAPVEIELPKIPDKLQLRRARPLPRTHVDPPNPM